MLPRKLLSLEGGVSVQRVESQPRGGRSLSPGAGSQPRGWGLSLGGGVSAQRVGSQPRRWEVSAQGGGGGLSTGGGAQPGGGVSAQGAGAQPSFGRKGSLHSENTKVRER